MAINDLNYLQRRNIELETELRLVKEQLAEARSGTQYLINCLSGRYAQLSVGKTSAYDITGRSAIANGLEADLISGPTFMESTACADCSYQESKTIKAKSLIDLEDDDHSPSVVAGDPGITITSPSSDPIDSPLQGQVEWHAHRSPEHAVKSPSRSTPTTRETPTPFHPPTRPRGDRSAQTPRIYHPHPFEDHEHNRLMGSAMFIEEMSEEEQMQHWSEFQFRNRNHSVLEWKTYYDTVIRPAFLQKSGDAAAKAEPKAVQTQSPPMDVKDLWMSKGESAPELSRTVLISNLNAGITLTEMWSDFRLGWDKVVSATLLKTSGMKTVPPIETDSAMVVFHGAGLAEEFVERYGADAVVVRTGSRAR